MTNGRARSGYLAAVVVLGLVIGGFGLAGRAEAQADPEIELVERFAPILALRPQSEACDTSGERWAPAPAEIVLDNPHMLLRQWPSPLVLLGGHQRIVGLRAPALGAGGDHVVRERESRRCGGGDVDGDPGISEALTGFSPPPGSVGTRRTAEEQTGPAGSV